MKAKVGDPVAVVDALTGERLEGVQEADDDLGWCRIAAQRAPDPRKGEVASGKFVFNTITGDYVIEERWGPIRIVRQAVAPRITRGRRF